MTLRIRCRLMRGLLITTALALLTGPSFAQEEPGDREIAEDRIVVRSSAFDRPLVESLLGTSVLTEEELARRGESSIGETLRREPGLSSTFFGPAASRPVIRGLGGDRVRILDAGIGSIDASATSADHAVAVEPALAERIEILRGTAMLLYGSSAAGGVINIYDGRIPVEAPEGGFDLGLRYGTSTVDEGQEFAGAANVLLGQAGGGQFVAHVDGFWRDTEDYEIPGFAESAALRALEEDEGEDHEQAFGLVENSDLSSKGGAAGLSYIFGRGFFGGSVKVTRSNYGVPGGHGHEEDEEEEGGEHGEEAVRIDLDQTRYDLWGEIDLDTALFSRLRVRAGYGDYEHTELEGGEVGTVFANEGFEGRAELKQQPWGRLNGTVGVQIRSRDFSAIGAEAFVPPTESFQTGVFAVEEVDLGRWIVEFGGRYEHTSHEAADLGLERDFHGFSVSAGGGLRLFGDEGFVGATLFRTERAPATEELFSNGPHLATNAFEIGDPDLGLEKALGFEATAHGHFGPFSAQVNVFHTRYTDFIYETPAGEEEDGLPVFAFLADDARFTGFEAQIKTEFTAMEIAGLTLAPYADAAVDLVRAQLLGVSGNDRLPRIPPVSGLFGAGFRSSHVDFRVEVEYAAAQERVTEFELPTDSHTLVNLFASVRPFGGTRDISLDVRALNVTDEEARLHTSFLKDLIPLPGRNVKLSLRAAF